MLDHLRGMVVEEGPTDGGVMGVETAMDGSRGRCFLRAKHELASVAFGGSTRQDSRSSQAQAGLAPGWVCGEEGRKAGQVPAAKAAIASSEGARLGPLGRADGVVLSNSIDRRAWQTRRVAATRTAY